MESIQKDKDRLGLFDDAPMSIVRVAELRRLAREAGYSSMGGLAKGVGISWGRTRQDRVRVSGKVRGRLLDLVRIYNNALSLYGTESEARAWLISPNGRFYGLSPLTMALAGRGEAVYLIQDELLGAVPAQRSHRTNVVD